jgi:hypothetical protein
VRSRDARSRQAAPRIAKITKTFLLTKEIRALRTKKLRDHRAAPVRGHLLTRQP